MTALNFFSICPHPCLVSLLFFNHRLAERQRTLNLPRLISDLMPWFLQSGFLPPKLHIDGHLRRASYCRNRCHFSIISHVSLWLWVSYLVPLDANVPQSFNLGFPLSLSYPLNGQSHHLIFSIITAVLSLALLT